MPKCVRKAASVTLDGLHLVTYLKSQEGNLELDSHGSLNIYQHYSPVWLWAYLLRKFFGLEFNLLSSFTLIKKKKAPKSIVQKNIEMEQEEPINDEMKRFPKGPKLYKPIFAAKMIQQHNLAKKCSNLLLFAKYLTIYYCFVTRI